MLERGVDVDVVCDGLHTVVRRPAAQQPVSGARITTGHPVVGEVVLDSAESAKTDPVARRGRVLRAVNGGAWEKAFPPAE